MSEDDLRGATPAALLAKDLRRREADAVDVTAAALARANGNASRNTYLWLQHEAALDRAASLPRCFPDRAPSLYGLPVSLKDCFHLEGTPTSAGTRYYADHIPPAAQHSEVAMRLLGQGAVILGKTHLHPLAYGITGENPEFGDCLQPDAPELLTGGSSSGAAASVMEGSAVAAIGTDTGGSIRVPAALCGLSGYRSSFAVSRDVWRGGMHLAPSFDTVGWLHRDLEDGPWLARSLFDLPETPTRWQQPRVGFISGDLLASCEPAVLEGFAGVQQECLALGAQAVPVDVGFWSEALEVYAGIQAHEASALHAGRFAAFGDVLRQRLEWGASIGDSEIADLRRRHAGFCRQMDALFETVDLLLLPASPVAALRAGADHSAARPLILRYTTPASLAGLPVVTVPAAAGRREGGIQVMGRPGEDAALLAWTAQLGRARRAGHARLR